MCLPLQPGNVAMYVLSLKDRNLQVNTVRQKLLAISYLHHLHKMSDPCKDVVVLNVVKAMARVHVPTKQKNPITLGLLDCILEVVHTVVAGAYQAHLYRAIFSVMYHVCLRPGECVLMSKKADHALRWQQVAFQNDVRMKARFVSYMVGFEGFKHSAGRCVPPIKVDRENGSRYCPVTILKFYMAAHPLRSGYLFVHEDGKPVTGSTAASVLTKAMQRLRLDPRDYSLHSFRSGKCTDLVSSGRSSEGVKAVGRRRSSAADVYNRPAFVVS